VGAPFTILLLGGDVKNAVTEAAAFGAQKVLVASDASSQRTSGGAIRADRLRRCQVGQLRRDRGDRQIVRQDLAPRVAAKLAGAMCRTSAREKRKAAKSPSDGPCTLAMPTATRKFRRL